MSITNISKRLGYFIWALGGWSWNSMESFGRMAYKTLYKGEKVFWVYQTNITPEEAGVIVVNDSVKGETYVVPDEPVKARKVNKYHLRYNYSARGV